MALDADSVVHILLVGPPASAKTMFLTSLMHHLKRSYFADGTNSTKSGTWNISSLTRISQKVPSNVIFTLNLTSATNVANQPDVKLECLTSHLPSIAGTTAARIMKNYSSNPLPHEKLSMP